MTETLARLLLRLSEAGSPAYLWGRQASPYMGPAFERLLERGVLIEQPRATTWQTCFDCECGLDERPVELIDGQPVAVCPSDHRNDARLSADDLTTYLIDPEMFVGELVRGVSLATRPSEISPGLWHCGRVGTDIDVFVALAEPAVLQPGLRATIRETLGQSTWLLIGPTLSAGDRTHLVDRGFRICTFDEALRVDDTGACRLDLSGLLEGPAETVRLIVDGRAQCAVVEGRAVDMPAAPFKLLRLFTEAVLGGGRLLTAQQIEAKFSQREAPDLVRELRKCLQRAGLDAATAAVWIRTHRSPTRYGLSLAPGEIEYRRE